MRALGAREGIRFDFDSLIIAPTSRAHRVIAAAHDADIDNDTVAGPDSLHLKVAEAIMRSHFEMGLDISHPEVLIGCAQDIGMPPDLAALAVGDEEWASRVYSDYQMAMHMGVTSVPTYVLDAQFLVDGHQTVTAFPISWPPPGTTHEGSRMSEKDTTASSVTTGAPSPMELVLQFHRTYSTPIRPFDDPTLDYERVSMRMSPDRLKSSPSSWARSTDRAHALSSEAATAEAVAADDGTRDVIETADALADLVYVIYGMAIESGMDLDSVLAEVQASNLSKLMPDGSVKLREDGKVLKGPNFFQPNIARGLGLESPTDSGDAD